MELSESEITPPARADGARKYTVSDAVVRKGTKLTSAGNVCVQTTNRRIAKSPLVAELA